MLGRWRDYAVVVQDTPHITAMEVGVAPNPQFGDPGVEVQFTYVVAW